MKKEQTATTVLQFGRKALRKTLAHSLYSGKGNAKHSGMSTLMGLITILARVYGGPVQMVTDVYCFFFKFISQAPVV